LRAWTIKSISSRGVDPVASGERVRCECGKEYTIVAHSPRPSIRCHMCGRSIDLSCLMVAKAERETAEKFEQAQRVNFAGLRFDGFYRTASPVQFDGAFAVSLELSLHFSSQLVVDYNLKILDDNHGVQIEVDQYGDRAGYEITSDQMIRFAFDTGIWVCEWEGSVRDDMLILFYRIEEFFGLSSGPKCVREGSASLGFQSSANVD
jgi:hypothetical protein